MSCDYEARGKNDREILTKVTEHARKTHNMREIPKELQQKVKSAIHNV
jgi:predicted small metal-binding protein